MSYPKHLLSATHTCKAGPARAVLRVRRQCHLGASAQAQNKERRRKVDRCSFLQVTAQIRYKSHINSSNGSSNSPNDEIRPLGHVAPYTVFQRHVKEGREPVDLKQLGTKGCKLK